MLLPIGCSGNAVGKTPDMVTLAPGTSLLMGKIAFEYWHGKHDIYVMNADGSDVENLTASLAYSRGPAWSPDGHWLAFSAIQDFGPSQIYVMALDGSKPKQLTFDKEGSYGPVWSPDGEYILFLSERDGVLSSERGIPVPEIYLMNSDGSNQRRVTNNQDLNEYSLSWSPKWNLIAVSIGNPKISRHSTEIYLMGLDGVIQKQLTPSGYNYGNYSPRWSPDGESITFFSFGQSDCSGINIMKADGSNRICLVIEKAFPPVQNRDPAWSPDGKHIIFSSNLDGDFDLYIVKVDGSDLTQLTNLPGNETSPVWSAGP